MKISYGHGMMDDEIMGDEMPVRVCEARFKERVQWQTKLHITGAAQYETRIRDDSR
jgi:hypothetical protein